MIRIPLISRNPTTKLYLMNQSSQKWMENADQSNFTEAMQFFSECFYTTALHGILPPFWNTVVHVVNNCSILTHLRRWCVANFAELNDLDLSNISFVWTNAEIKAQLASSPLMLTGLEQDFNQSESVPLIWDIWNEGVFIDASTVFCKKYRVCCDHRCADTMLK